MNKIQEQIQWINWKCDELYRKQQDLKSSTNLVRKASLGLVEHELKTLQQIGATLVDAMELGNILKRFER
jgi:hypothetical protein